MSTPRFYIENNNYKINDIINLPINIVHHIKVLRLQKDDIINLFNNDYTITATINKLDKYSITALINTITTNVLEKKVLINLAVSLLNNDKMDLIIQKVTELGVNSLTPIIFERTQKINPNKISKKYEHWEKIIINACEQSGRNNLMAINPLSTFNDYIRTIDYDLKIICNTYLDNDNSIIAQKNINNIAIIIGPEGGITNKEIEYAKTNRCLTLKIGEHILRSETAAIVAAGTLNIFYNNIIQFKF